MDKKLTETAITLLEQARHAIDNSTNGPYDRVHLIRLISKFSDFARKVLKDVAQIDYENKAMAKRLSRSPFTPDASAATTKVKPYQPATDLTS